ncbi:MAG: hypothetical protein HC923_03425 [Myxococcales bacterium]|nr:hypothetical protein [Myxococcales bacterium]
MISAATKASTRTRSGSGQRGRSIRPTSSAPPRAGFYTYASDAIQLSQAFDLILQDIIANDAVTFGASTVSSEGLFTGNYVYISMFRPEQAGPWRGNFKKTCVLPELRSNGLYDTSETRCLFRASSDGKRLIGNNNARDRWAELAGMTGQAQLDATDLGGAARLVLRNEFSNVAPEANVTWTDHWTKRDIYTWKPGSVGYLDVNPIALDADLVGLDGCPAIDSSRTCTATIRSPSTAQA